MDPTKSTLVQVMAWCRQATSHYLSQCWPRPMPPYGVISPWWVNLISLIIVILLNLVYPTIQAKCRVQTRQMALPLMPRLLMLPGYQQSTFWQNTMILGKHYYHARYHTDDWHLACMFSLVYFSVEVYLVGVFPHSVSIWSDPCARACVPLMNWHPPSRENNIVQGVTRFSTWAKGEGGGHLNWRAGLPTLLGGNLGCWIV